MLTIAKLGVGQESYYLAKVARGVEDYYSGDGESPGTWMGRGAARLGLIGDVPGAHLRAGLAGRNPLTDNQLAGRPGARRVPGWDLTFCAPKSVSLLYALGDHETSSAVVEAHETAVAEALHYLERHATVSRRRTAGVVRQIVGEGLVIAAFRHRTSRAGDPHLHTHALALNMVERVGGGWGALHSTVLYRHARTAGFLYQAVLRGELTERLGVAWEPVHNGYAEVDGFDRSLLTAFSKRHADIDDELGGVSEPSAREAEIAQRRTKSAKEYGIDGTTLHARWHAEAASVGPEPARVVAAVTGYGHPEITGRHLDNLVDVMVSSVGLTAHQSTFDRRDIVRAWCEGLPAGVPVELETVDRLTDSVIADPRVLPIIHQATEVPASVRADGSVVSAAPDRRRWSTDEMLAVEQRLVEHAIASRDVGVGQVDQQAVRRFLGEHSDLTLEQREMVEAITTSGNGIDVVVGRAGTGKTFALAAAAAVWRDHGFQPIGVALAARAANELESSDGISSTTAARYLMDVEQAPLDSIGERHVVVVDEAGMVDTRRLARIVRHAEGSGAKVVLVGDHHQLPAVEAGGAFAALVNRLEPIELTENRRQVEAWERLALDRLRDDGGLGVGGVVAAYGDRGRLHFGPNPADVRTAMVADWYAASRQGERVAMIALRRSDVESLNRLARSMLLDDGTVQDGGVTARDVTFAVGDRVVCLNNDRRLGVHNAMFGVVIAADEPTGALTMEVEHDGRHLVIPHAYSSAGHLAHAYAMTIHKAQGATFDRSLLLGDDRLYRQAGYTALSRGRQSNDLYLVVDDDREHDPEMARHGQAPPEEPVVRITRALARDGAKVMAVDERQPESGTHFPTLADLWSERDRRAEQDQFASAERVEELDQAIARRTSLAGRAAEFERPNHLVAVIGEPPLSLIDRDRWRRAAGEVESYTARWQTTPFDPPASNAPPAQLEHQLEVETAVAAVNQHADAALELA